MPMFDCTFVFKRDGNGGMFEDTPCSFSQAQFDSVQSLSNCTLLSFQENRALRCFKRF